VRAAFARGDLSDGVLDHLESCEACASAAEEVGLLSPVLAAAPDPGLLAGTKARIAGDRNASGWIKARPTGQRRTILAAVTFAILAGAFVLVRRPDFDTYPPLRMAASLAALFVLIVASFAVGTRPIHLPARSPWIHRALVVAGIAGAFLVAIVPVAEVGGRPSDLITALGMPCLYFGVLIAIPVFALAKLLDRGRNPIAVLLAGLASGLFGEMVLQVHCPSCDPLHLVFGHFTVVLAFVLLVLGIGWIERCLEGS
jgi:hypothetical protein